MTLTMNCPTESCITWNLQNFKYLSFQQFNICNDFADLSSQTLVECDRIKEKNYYISWSEAKTYHIPSFTWRWVTFKKIIIISEEDWKTFSKGVCFNKKFFQVLSWYTNLHWTVLRFLFLCLLFLFLLFHSLQCYWKSYNTKKYLCHPLSFSILSWQDL